MPKVSTKEKNSNAVQGEINSLKTGYQVFGNPGLDANIRNQVSL